MQELITKAKRALCYPEKGGMAMRKELKDIIQSDLNEQWEALNKLQEIKTYTEEEVINLLAEQRGFCADILIENGLTEVDSEFIRAILIKSRIPRK